MTMIHSCRLLEIIVLGSADTRIRHFRMTFKLPCGSLASRIHYRKDLNIWEIHLLEMSKSHPGRRLDCFTLQLAFLRPSWTYSGLKLNRVVVQSTLPHFSSESSPSGKFWHFQVSHDHDTLLQVIGDNCLDVSFEFQIDAFTETGGAGAGISAPGPVRRNPFLACHKGAAVPLLKRWPSLKVFVIT